MNLQKAIEQLKDHQMEYACDLDADTLNAIQLGIEAIKRLEKLRLLYFDPARKTLPGETEK